MDASYRPSYSNLSSSESRIFITNFTDTVESFFRDARLPGFRTIEVTRLSKGSVVVDFIILVERNSNTTKNTIIATLIDGNSTGTLGFALSGDISINEITELSTTDIPTSKAAREGKKVFLNKYSGTIQNHQWFHQGIKWAKDRESFERAYC